MNTHSPMQFMHSIPGALSEITAKSTTIKRSQLACIIESIIPLSDSERQIDPLESSDRILWMARTIWSLSNEKSEPTANHATLTLLAEAIRIFLARMSQDESKMAYHNRGHVLSDTLPSMIIMLDEARAEGNESLPKGDNLLALIITNFVHDIVYTVGAPIGENERKSVEAYENHMANIALDPKSWSLYNRIRPIIAQAVEDTVPTVRASLSERPWSIGAMMADCDVFSSLAEGSGPSRIRTRRVVKEMEAHNLDASKITPAGFMSYAVPMGFVSDLGKPFQGLFKTLKSELTA